MARATTCVGPGRIREARCDRSAATPAPVGAKAYGGYARALSLLPPDGPVVILISSPRCAIAAEQNYWKADLGGASGFARRVSVASVP